MSTMYNIDDETSDIEITDDTVAGAIVSFASKLNNTGMISRGEVLALEEFTGTAIITSTLSSNSFSEISSYNGVDELKQTLAKVTSKIKLQDVITEEDLLTLARRTVVDLRRTSNFIKTLLTNKDASIIESFLNDKNIYRYNDDTLINLTTINVVELIERYFTYFDKIVDYNNDHNIFNSVNNEDTSLVLLSLLLNKDKDFTIYQIGRIPYLNITMVEIIDMLNNTDTVIARLDNILKSVFYTVQELESPGKHFDIYDTKDIKKFHKMFTMLGDIFNDKLSLDIIRLVTSKAKQL